MFLYIGLLYLHISIASAYTCTDSFGGCSDLATINRPLSELHRLQPLYRNVIINRQLPNADNLCFTLAQLPDPNSYVIYESTTYTDGSYEVLAFVLRQDTSSYGVFQSSSQDGPISDYNVGCAGCYTDIHYDCYLCNGTLNLVQGLAFTYTNLTDACLSRTKDLLSSQNIPVTSVQVLPQRLRPNCYKPPNSISYIPSVNVQASIGPASVILAA